LAAAQIEINHIREGITMAEKFGKTWWGEHWLLSLENVDYDNRLPRGASYARSGGIKVRLDRYYITAETYKPVITVSEY
jgi:hypothetical protein